LSDAALSARVPSAPEYWRRGVVERAVLEAMDQLGARRDRPHPKRTDIIGLAVTDLGISHRFGCDAVCSMARPWSLHLLLVDFRGNLGSADEYDCPGPARATEARMSYVGMGVLSAERGSGPTGAGLVG
jgi:DNA gyrase/topoisomerase IV subunit A